MSTHQYLVCEYKDSEGKEQSTSVYYSRRTKLFDIMPYIRDETERTEVPVFVLAMLYAAYEAVRALRPTSPTALDECSYDHGDMMYDNSLVYWEVLESDVELYSKLCAYVPYIYSCDEPFDVCMFDKADEDRKVVRDMLTRVSDGTGKVFLYLS